MVFRLSVLVAFLAVTLAATLAARHGKEEKPTKQTMKKLCEMPEFQQAMAADEGKESSRDRRWSGSVDNGEAPQNIRGVKADFGISYRLATIMLNIRQFTKSKLARYKDHWLFLFQIFKC